MEDFSKIAQQNQRLTVGDYVIDLTNVFHEGNEFTSYWCTLKSDPNQVFVAKVMERSIQLSQQMVARSEEIKKIIQKAASPFVVRLCELGVCNKRIVYIYDYCNQKSLREFIQLNQQFLNEENLVCLFFQILKGYYFSIFQNSIMHRDINPEHILLHNGVPKFFNFRLSKHSPQINYEILQSARGGNVVYSSPEMMDIGGVPKYSYKTDIYSLGIVFYQCLFGSIPFLKNQQTAGTPEEGQKDLIRPPTTDSFLQAKKDFSEGKFQFPLQGINQFLVSQKLKDLIVSMCEEEEKKRISIEQALCHPIFNMYSFIPIGFFNYQYQPSLLRFDDFTFMNKLIREPNLLEKSSQLSSFFNHFQTYVKCLDTIYNGLSQERTTLENVFNIPKNITRGILLIISVITVRIVTLNQFIFQSLNSDLIFPMKMAFFNSEDYKIINLNLLMESENSNRKLQKIQGVFNGDLNYPQKSLLNIHTNLRCALVEVLSYLKNIQNLKGILINHPLFVRCLNLLAAIISGLDHCQQQEKSSQFLPNRVFNSIQETYLLNGMEQISRIELLLQNYFNQQI